MKTLKNCALWLLALCTLFVFDIQSLSAQNANEPQLLMTIGCLSDLHGQGSLISGTTAQVRSSVTKAVNYLKNNEQIDVLLLGGDFTSQTKISESQWQAERNLIATTMRQAFNGRTPTPILYTNGNHEYQAPYYTSTKTSFSATGSDHMAYNSGDYYTFPMKDDVGELSADECFYEDAQNGAGQTMRLLAAYHYVINGFDFIVLNTGKYLFLSKDNLYYSQESVQWVANKLAAIYDANPNKTVFFLAHIPFGDSNSISETSKGMSTSQPSTALLKQTLAQYPNVIMLYGHDHKADKAYIKDKTSQRVTRYDTSGNVISSFDADHVDGTTQGTSSTGGSTGSSTSTTPSGYYLKNLGNSKYLGMDATDINVFSNPQVVYLEDVGSDNLVRTLLTYTDGKHNLHCGGSGNYSKDQQTTSTSSLENQWWYKVEDATASTVTANKVTDFSTIEAGKQYIIVGIYNKKYYALTNTLTGDTSKQRIQGYQVGSSLPSQLSLSNAKALPCIYTLEKANGQEELTPSTVNPSFISSFMGSCRYYSNAVTTGSGDSEENPIVQGLMIYVYENRIEFRMKNFGTVESDGTVRGTSASGKSTGSVKLTNPPTPYTIFRTVSTEPQPEVSPISVMPTGGTAYEESPVSDEGSLTINDACDGFKVTRATEVENLTYSRTFKNTEWQAWYVPFTMTLTPELASHYHFAKLAGAIAHPDGSLYISFIRLNAGDEIKANTPYLVQATTSGTAPQTFFISDATLQPTEASEINSMTTEQIFTFSGFYDRKRASETDRSWYALSAGSFKMPTATASVGPFRFILTVTDRDVNPYASSVAPTKAQSIPIHVEGYDATESIGEVIDSGLAVPGSSTVVSLPINLQGQRTALRVKGIIIQDGKKRLLQ